LLNQRTLDLLLTISDATGRPLMMQTPLMPGTATAPGSYKLNGSPVVVVSQMPDCLPGSTPIGYGN
jgi:HK97 family phage major capsid protein